MAHILIIDDHAELCDLLVTVLTARGHTASSATDGEAGLRLFQRDRPDLVITDLNMPKTDGLGVLAHLQREHPEVPLIVMSGSFADDTSYYQQVADRYGAVHVLHKPFHLPAFWQTVHAALRALQPPADSASPFAAVPELVAI